MYLKGLKPTVLEHPPSVTGEQVEVVVLYADLRDFSEFSNSANPGHVAQVVQICYERVIQLVLDAHHQFHKFLGDGYLLLWEVADHGSIETALAFALEAAFEIHKKYWYARQQLNFATPLGFGIGIACGTVVRVQPETFFKELNEPDFVGYPMNLGARLQTLAEAYGVVLDNKGAIACQAHPEIFSERGHQALGYELLIPNSRALEKASGLKGVKQEDRKNFRYVVLPALQQLWRANGQPKD